ncbi:MAG: NAD(P)-dependent oxidoreductase [Candidatus Eremiobacteraeota bacterium]|nr:NAD(P)-dependent oxidoreductase [Candidatus Eremiobacteraeota bacterium]MBV8354388.1 NAD(P)-dependent oxidoreductase [Candidatus Eremiobacteraeota bacterium]
MYDSVLFIGAGNMGGPMATRLADAGVGLAVADLSPPALAPFAARGLSTARRGGALDGDVVITMLPTSADVRAALFGEGGALERPRQAAIDMTSGEPLVTREIARDLAARGVLMLDAPVSGGTAGAKNGTLTAMVGGDAAVLARYEPLLRCMCATILHAGASGAGDTMKALNNFLSGIALWATSEALVVGARAGLDPAVMLETWRTSTGRNHTVEVKGPRHLLPRTFDAGFSLGLIAKDVAIAADLARALDVDAPMLAAAEAKWNSAREALGASTDFTRVLTLIERSSGFEIPAVPAAVAVAVKEGVSKL